jgi:riboflavin synthase
MFNGLIREIGIVKSYKNSILEIESSLKPKIGDSIAINGACLTAVKTGSDFFSVQLSPESETFLAIENFKHGKKVHLETAMAMGDRFEGHIIQGHIDSIGTIYKIEKFGNSYNFYILVSKNILKFIVPKGSIAIDGVSLTINEVIISEAIIRLTIINHTLENSIFNEYLIGHRVNIETDIFARYISHIIDNRFSNSSDSWDYIDKIMARY